MQRKRQVLLLLTSLTITLSLLGCRPKGIETGEDGDGQVPALKEDIKQKEPAPEKSAIDKLIEQHDRDSAVNPCPSTQNIFKNVLQGLKEGTWNINDKFMHRSPLKKSNGGYLTVFPNDKQWDTFLTHVVRPGSTPGNHIPYFEYAKEKGADFKITDYEGNSLLHLLLTYNTSDKTIREDLEWLLSNTDVKAIINKKRLKEDGSTHSNSTPLDYAKGLDKQQTAANNYTSAILLKHDAK